jgi:hypothetical protein
MIKQATSLARRATRWWSAPVRFTNHAAQALRDSAPRRGGLWLKKTPVGIRAGLDTPS